MGAVSNVTNTRPEFSLLAMLQYVVCMEANRM